MATPTSPTASMFSASFVQYLIANLAVGGNGPSQPVDFSALDPPGTTLFLDYVRVYALPDGFDELADMSWPNDVERPTLSMPSQPLPSPLQPLLPPPPPPQPLSPPPTPTTPTTTTRCPRRRRRCSAPRPSSSPSSTASPRASKCARASLSSYYYDDY